MVVQVIQHNSVASVFSVAFFLFNICSVKS